VKCKHAPCHSFNYFESGTQAVDMLYMSHATKSTALQSAAVTETHSNNIRLSRFAWTTYAKSLGKICYIAGLHNTGPAGQMWPAISLKMARKRFTECSQCFQGKLKQLSTDNTMQFKSMTSFINKTRTDLVPDLEKYVKMCEDLRENFKTLSRS